MKTLLATIVLLAVTALSVQAQHNPLDGMISAHQSQPGFYFLEMNTNMLSDESGKVIHLKMLSYDEKDNGAVQAGQVYDDFFRNFDKNAYKGLVQIKSSGDNVEMMVKQNGEEISELIVAVKGETETILIAATGNFNMKDLAKFSNLGDCKGLEVMHKLCEE